MKKIIRTTVFLLLFTSIGQMVSAQQKNIFFTEKDTANWVYVLRDKKLNPTKVFGMKNGILAISGESTGYLRTHKKYKNYTLEVDWRWTKTPGNSGVLVHITEKDTVWPKCYQVQQKTDAAGDIICMNGLWAKECKDSVRFTIRKQLPSNEKPVGEWNKIKIVSKNKTLKVWVNGILQNFITGLSVEKGYIGFQNEGKALEFRNLILK